jgi:hypothetical protein
MIVPSSPGDSCYYPRDFSTLVQLCFHTFSPSCLYFFAYHVPSGLRYSFIVTQSPSFIQMYLYSNVRSLQLLLVIYICHFFFLLRFETLHIAFQPTRTHYRPYQLASTSSGTLIFKAQLLLFLPFSAYRGSVLTMAWLFVSILSISISRLECYCHFGKTLNLLMLDSRSYSRSC